MCIHKCSVIIDPNIFVSLFMKCNLWNQIKYLKCVCVCVGGGGVW